MSLELKVLWARFRSWFHRQLFTPAHDHPEGDGRDDCSGCIEDTWRKDLHR